MAKIPEAKAAAPVELHVRQAKARAHVLCEAGNLQEAVLSMCLDLGGCLIGDLVPCRFGLCPNAAIRLWSL
ncbi:hypothetical protein D3C81_1886660 [compost metagenome]